MDVARPSLFERMVDRVPFLEKELLLLRTLVRPGDVCVDVGAAGGAHLFVMASRAGPSGRVIGIEPRPGSHRLLQAAVRVGGLRDRVTLVQAALADRRGRQELRIPVVPTRAHFRGSSRARLEVAAFAQLPHRTIEVPTLRLDDVVDDEGLDRVDVLKCDVEGAELLVLSGATRVLERQRPTVIIEADDLHQRRFDATAQEVLDAVVAQDYRPHRYRQGSLEQVEGIVEGEDDYVLLPAERCDVDRQLRTLAA